MKKSGGFFQLADHDTTMKREVTAGIIGFFTIIYIVAVNSFILSEAGVPFEGAVVATILASSVGCVVMAFWANAPILLVPGMGLNAMFAYTFVQSMALSWQEALGVVVVSGLLFVLVSVTKMADWLNASIPPILKEAISVGLGFFLMLIGLEKGGLVVRGEHSILALGNLGDPAVLITVLTLIVTLIVFLKGVPGGFLWSILFGTVAAWVAGLLPEVGDASFSVAVYNDVFAAFSLSDWLSVPFWSAVFSLTMVLVFENVGLVHGHTEFAGRPDKFKRALQANAFSSFSSGIFGTSPTVSTVESSAMIAAGGRTGLTTLTAGILFLLSVFAIPYMKLIPDMAIAPVLMMIGSLMIQNIRHLDLTDLTEAVPALFIIVMIPFTYSIADGIAAGFILYPLLKVVMGRGREVSKLLWIVSVLFLLNFVVHYA
ncbi:NCS2 family permease [Pseudobacillus badius]|uniref:NCS2 family permease n=1 Tax=Bacillus badius TaxID=1455 RepID=UPI0007B06704|nr:NCS2 family permease [Bacillus badius]KZN99841.1 permease [Bacillus badius]OCS85945.1 permease [Bacillus badius]OVE51695.1 NCS2 family permease [Bacillus badius]TDW03111.1 AGZA family xanthine/uracil permease-like MFS transporter [Bacillus badius]UAT32373.1 NCS2 family permease [Bacillus badius]